jgi:transposase-like protein
MKSKPDRNLHGFKRTQYLAEDERCRLLYGPYEPPLVKGGFLVDMIRGQVKFSHFTNARIPWPKCKKPKSISGGGSGGFVLCGDLVRALTDESAPAIAYHWGVSQATITNWRRALELRGLNAGSHRLMEIGVELARRPESRAKNSASKQGKVLSRTNKLRLFAGIKAGWKERFEARREDYRRTGRFPKATKSDPWIPEEEELLAKHSTTELVRIIRRTRKGIVVRRLSLGIRTRPPPIRRSWIESETKMLGTDTDDAIAKRLERSVFSVTKKRQALGIRRLSPTH